MLSVRFSSQSGGQAFAGDPTKPAAWVPKQMCLDSWLHSRDFGTRARVAFWLMARNPLRRKGLRRDTLSAEQHLSGSFGVGAQVGQSPPHAH